MRSPASVRVLWDGPGLTATRPVRPRFPRRVGSVNRTNVTGLSVTDSQVTWYDLVKQPIPPPGGGLGGNSRASGVGRLNGLPKGSAGVPRGSLAGQRARFGPLPRASRAGDPGGDPLGIPGGSKGAPKGSAWVLGGSGLLETPKRRGFRGDPVGPLYHCIILIKGTHDFRARGRGGRRASRILLCRSF